MIAADNTADKAYSQLLQRPVAVARSSRHHLAADAFVRLVWPYGTASRALLVENHADTLGASDPHQ